MSASTSYDIRVHQLGRNSDASVTTWLTYNDPNWLAKRHGLGPEADATVKAMAAALDAMAKMATARQ